MKKLKFVFVGVTLILSVWLIDACRTPGPGKTIVTVVTEDTLGLETKIAGAVVTMYSKPNGSYIDYETELLEDERPTNAAGLVEFTKEYNCILSLKVKYETTNGAILEGKGIAIFKHDETYETTIEID